MVATLLLTLAAVGEAHAVTGREIVAHLNAQRAASKIPAGIKFSESAAADCAAHNRYQVLNGSLTHDEVPSAPGYTAAGAEAALKAVLYRGVSWTRTANPFENAPIHLAQTLAPRIDVMGADETSPFGCATTLASRKRKAPKTKRIYTYPRDKATGWRTSELAAEAPYTPGQRRGIPAGTVTGPYLLVMFDGPSLHVFSEAKVKSASLRGPGGKDVKVRVADNRTSGLAGYLPTGAYVIPLQPLAPATRYTARISASIVGQPKLKFVHKWSFTTG